MFNHITINESSYRENDFNHPDSKIISQRWVIDFYIDNPDYLEYKDSDPQYLIDEEIPEFNHSYTYFTSYSSKELTAKEALKFLQLTINMLFDSLKLSSCRYANQRVFTMDYDYNTLLQCHTESTFYFLNKLKFPTVLSAVNSDKFFQGVYVYYSSLKWLDMAINGGASDLIFETNENLLNFANSKQNLINKPTNCNY